MRSVAVSELIEMVVRLLEDTVAPSVDDYASSRALWVSVGLLDNLAARVDERPEGMREEIALLQDLADCDPARVAGTADEPTGDDLHQRLSQLRAFHVARLRGLAVAGAAEPEALAWLARCHEVLLRLTDRELERLRSTRYARANGAASRRRQ